jgi:hypothetical protein
MVESWTGSLFVTQGVPGGLSQPLLRINTKSGRQLCGAFGTYSAADGRSSPAKQGRACPTQLHADRYMYIGSRE